MTDGTIAGSSELAVAGAWPGGLTPAGFTDFGGEVLLSGKDTSGNNSLRVTDGTAAGTSETTPSAPLPFSVRGAPAPLPAGLGGA